MNIADSISQQLAEAAHVLKKFSEDPARITAVAEAAGLFSDALRAGNKALTCGNGGSMCDAMHFAEELTGRYRNDRRAMPAIAMADVSHMSCVANDFGYDQIFSRYVEALGNRGDVLLAISTSGNSPNILKAAEAAREKGMKVVALTGKGGGKLSGLSDVLIDVDHQGYADRIQEIHIKVIHILILHIEQAIRIE